MVEPVPTFVSHLECAATGATYPADTVQGLSDAGKPLLVRYDLDALGRAVSRADLADAPGSGFWRYAPLLPVRKAANRLSLGEVTTPLVPLPRRGASLLVKDEGRLPTGCERDGLRIQRGIPSCSATLRTCAAAAW